jgi:hypothetical protein
MLLVLTIGVLQLDGIGLAWSGWKLLAVLGTTAERLLSLPSRKQ